MKTKKKSVVSGQKSAETETVAQRNERLIAVAVARRRRLTKDEALSLACGFAVKQAVNTKQKDDLNRLNIALEILQHELTERSRLAAGLSDAAMNGLDKVSCSASKVVWQRAANLVRALKLKHFPETNGECGVSLAIGS